MSHSPARNQSGHLATEHATRGRLTIRNTTRYAYYDKFYQNVFPRDVLTRGATAALAGYSSATTRSNPFNQFDVIRGVATAAVWRTLLAGVEVGHQQTGNFRRTGYFAAGGTLDTVAFARPITEGPVDSRQSATDADNDVSVTTSALYAQDQIALPSRWQAVLGVRYERFALAVANHRDASRLRREDALISPRGGLVFKPRDEVSLYASYGTSHLPSAGDQFSSLTVTTRLLEPERFTSYEVGGKWDVGAKLALTAAVYRLDRTNSSAKDPLDPSRIVQTGAQRTTGFERGGDGSARPAAHAVAVEPLRLLAGGWPRCLGGWAGAQLCCDRDTVFRPRVRRVEAEVFLALIPRVRSATSRRRRATTTSSPPRTLRVSLATAFPATAPCSERSAGRCPGAGR